MIERRMGAVACSFQVARTRLVDYQVLGRDYIAQPLSNVRDGRKHHLVRIPVRVGLHNQQQRINKLSSRPVRGLLIAEQSGEDLALHMTPNL